MSFKPNDVVKKESDDSDDIIFIKQEIDLTQIPSSTDYETSVTHVSESKYFKSLNQKYSIKSSLFLNKKKHIFQVRIINLFHQHLKIHQHLWPGNCKE